MDKYLFEAYEDGAGMIRLYIMDSEHRDLACIAHWEEQQPGTLIDALRELYGDPEAWRGWEWVSAYDINIDVDDPAEYDYARIAQILHEEDEGARETRTIADNYGGEWTLHPHNCGAEGVRQLRIDPEIYDVESISIAFV